MAWRFKASKYKNAAPIAPKMEDQVRGLSIGDYRGRGNLIAASAAFAAFNWEAQGSSLAVLPLSTKGRVNKASVPLLHAHSDFVTDFCFSPFDDGLLATGSQDLAIKLWRIPESGLTPGSGPPSPELTLPGQPRRVETLCFNPAADCVLASTSGESLTVWDVIRGKDLYSSHADHGDEIHSVSWQQSGRLLATQCKDRTLRVLDPRSGGVVAECESHQGIKDSKVVWVGDGDRILTSGFSADRFRELFVRDLRNLKQEQKNLTLDMSSGILIPLFDPDTNMCFLCGKGDRNVQFVEVTNREPFFVEGLKYSGDQTRGACLVPKRAMDVMSGEVNRVLQLCADAVVPIVWQVPRKSYREYHADIYPETTGLTAPSGPADWAAGEDRKPEKISLDPRKRPRDPLVVFQEGRLADRPASIEARAASATSSSNGHSNNGQQNGSPAFAKPLPKPRTSPGTSNGFSNGGSNGEDAAPSPNGGVFSRPRPPAKPRVVPSSKPMMDSPRPPPAPRNNLGRGDSTSATVGSSDDSVVVGDRGDANTLNPGRDARNEDDVGEDEEDEGGLAFLRRRPSIRDRKKLFEDNMRKNQEGSNGNGSSNGTTRPSAIPSRTPSDEENKENKLKEGGPPKPARNPDVELRKKNIFLANDGKKEEAVTKPAAARPVSQRTFGRVSKFKHLKGEVVLKGRFENLKNLSRTCPAECDFVHANADRIVLPLTGPGGKVAVVETRRPGRLPDGVTPALVNGATLMDLALDPHDTARVACAGDDGAVRIWRVPDGGLTGQVNQPEAQFAAHLDKIQVMRFHPLASGLLLTAAFDRSVRLWDLEDTEAPKIELQGHTDQLFNAQFSQCGKFVATLCRDGKIRIYDPRRSPDPIIEGGEIVPKKGARVVWALGGEVLIVTGFSRQSERQVMVYRTEDLKLLNVLVLDVSPAILIPHYDEDSNTLFLTGKGESTVVTFEVSMDPPHLFALSPYKPGGLHQGLAFLPKNVCDIRAVEFARAFRLTNTTIEPVAFSVPRVRTAFFQDDLFPATRVLWEATLTAAEWFAGEDRQAPRVSLQPEDMQALSGASSNAGATRVAPAQVAQRPALPLSSDRDSAKKAEANLESSVRVTVERSDRLEQDDMEGVDEKEWDDEED